VKFVNIKRRWLRRLVMVPAAPLFVPQYLYIGLRCMFYEFRACWSFRWE
jgi:hypothetical protein